MQLTFFSTLTNSLVSQDTL